MRVVNLATVSFEKLIVESWVYYDNRQFNQVLKLAVVQRLEINGTFSISERCNSRPSYRMAGYFRSHSDASVSLLRHDFLDCVSWNTTVLVEFVSLQSLHYLESCADTQKVEKDNSILTNALLSVAILKLPGIGMLSNYEVNTLTHVTLSRWPF